MKLDAATQRRTSREKFGIIIIPTVTGDKRMSLDCLNYIDIEQRSLCYHLLDENLKARHVLRTSFQKAIEGLLGNNHLLFLRPSLLINVDNVEFLTKDHMVFINGDVLYYPKKNYLEIYEKWNK
jgi:hypothetical protein